MYTLATLVVLSASAYVADATPTFGLGLGTCGLKLFWWKEKGCCLPYGGVPKPPSPPSGHVCVDNWYWSADQKCCVPQQPSTPAPSCGSGETWNADTYSCVPNTGPGSCSKGDFWWEKKSCCLPHGGIPAPPSPPNGYQCPSKWYWHGDKGCCVPSIPDAPETPACPSNCSWKSDSYWCAPNPLPVPEPPKTGSGSCSNSEFWWDKKTCCLPIGGPHSPPSPPEGTYCPSSWYWHTARGHCVPKTQPPKDSSPSCPATCSWIVESLWCKPLLSGPSSCSSEEFWWADRKCCLKNGGPKSPVSPPSGKTCPGGWSWGESQKCCVPHSPPKAQPTCGLGRKWSLTSFCCLTSGLIGGMLDWII